MSVQVRSAYRSVLREIAKSSIKPYATRNFEIARSFRTVLEERVGSDNDNNREKLFRDMRNAVTLIKSHRIHKELLDRYNPTHDMSQEERVHATARRVGLDTPIEAKPETSDK